MASRPHHLTQAAMETLAIHAGEHPDQFHGAACTPIFQSAMYEVADVSDYHDIPYIRLNNTPNHLALHEKLAALEGAEAALVTASGMGAITATLMSLLHHGDHVLAQNCLYGGTHAFLTRDFERQGLSYDFIDAAQPATWADKLKPSTRLFYVESIANPTMQVIDHLAVVAFSHRHQLVAVIDNTFLSPVNFRPLDLGYDLVIESATKYLNGHSDMLAGAVCGSAARVKAVSRIVTTVGSCLDPHACFLLQRGLKTLVLRVHHHNQVALELAQFLAKHSAVSEVHYPGLQTDPGHALAQRHFGGCGGVLSFRLHDGVTAADRLIGRLHLFLRAPSLGGVESLITRPSQSSHRGLSDSERQLIGIAPDLMRVSVGLEAARDLIADFEQALAQPG